MTARLGPFKPKLRVVVRRGFVVFGVVQDLGAAVVARQPVGQVAAARRSAPAEASSTGNR